MEYRIKFSITPEFFKKYMNHFPYLAILHDKSKINNKYNKTLFLDYNSEIDFLKLNIKEADVYYSCVYINDEYNLYFHSRDYEV